MNRGLSPGPLWHGTVLIRTRMPKSGGLLRDQQTLNETTVGHDTSCEISLTGKAFGKRTGKPGIGHLTVKRTHQA